jgi:sterol desaturase/sphingolipid hydroxylase (fatty acid hydroxylase superfamily)
VKTSQNAALVRHTLERMVDSPTNYWLVLVSDVVWALAFLVVGWAQYAGPPLVAITAIAVGVTGWGLLEYVLHRWILHGRPSIARRSHARHHGDVHALISTPLLVMLACALAIRALLALVLPSGILHHFQHRQGPTIARVGYWRKLLLFHDRHHHRPAVNYGVTTTIWDRVFGTFDPMDESRDSDLPRPRRSTTRS